MSDNVDKKDQLLTELKTTTTEVLGFICWWNVKGVKLTMKQFETHLEAVGIDKKYAREHNYRSSMIRALHDLEEQRIIRKVEEDDMKIVVQFTAENVVRAPGGEKALEYDKETIIVLDKLAYWENHDFAAALVRGKEEIKKQLVKHFNQHKTNYKSSDISRYIQRIFKDRADIISLREAGSIYFIPAAYENVITQVSNLLNSIGSGCTLDYAPLPKVDTAQTMVKNAMTMEMNNEFAALEEEFNQVTKGKKELNKLWSNTRINKLQRMLSRIEEYKNSGVVKAIDTKAMEESFAAMEKKITGMRKIDLDDEPVKPKKAKKESAETELEVAELAAVLSGEPVVVASEPVGELQPA